MRNKQSFERGKPLSLRARPSESLGSTRLLRDDDQRTTAQRRERLWIFSPPHLRAGSSRAISPTFSREGRAAVPSQTLVQTTSRPGHGRAPSAPASRESPL